MIPARLKFSAFLLAQANAAIYEYDYSYEENGNFSLSGFGRARARPGVEVGEPYLNQISFDNFLSDKQKNGQRRQELFGPCGNDELLQ